MASVAALLFLASLAAAPAAHGPDELVDDYPRALARARERNVPLLVDVWAPWCPSCRFMQGYVLRDRALAGLTRKVVRLEVNTELPANAPFVEEFPIDAWPSLLVIDPVEEKVALRWVGTATVAEVLRLADQGAGALRKVEAGRAEASLAEAHRLAASRQYAEAGRAFAEALARGGPLWPRRALAAEERVQALSFARDAEACAKGAEEALPLLAPGPKARVAAEGLACAASIEDPAAQRTAIEALEPAARRALGAKGLLADDRSGLYEALLEAREALLDEAGARSEARRWLAFLEAEARRAPDPLSRSAFDAARLAAATELGDPARALPPLLASVRDLPGDFAPLSSLAGLYLALDKPADALETSGKALVLAEGPRRVRLLVTRAQAQRKLGQADAARDTLSEAVRLGEAFPEALRPNTPLAQARKLLGELGG
jgi:thiol-disulfide isomerase/thioredoxin